jgi:hypothetical protein
MWLRDNVDVSTINWTNQASAIRRYAKQLPPGARRNSEIDRALACEAVAHSADLLFQTRMEQSIVEALANKGERDRYIAMQDKGDARR